LTKKHFIRAAEIVRAMVDAKNPHAGYVASAFEYLFSEYNPRFNRQCFLIACGFEGGNIG
jgi:hypothetical protein